MLACLALTRDHEPWPGGESRKRDLNRRLAAGPQASPAPSSSLRFNPAGSAARQDTNAAQGRTRTRLLRRLHEYQAFFCHKANIGRAVSMKPPITAASSMSPYHVNRDILLPEQQVDCRAMGHEIQFVDIRVPRRRHSCRGACREPKVGMARRRLTKVDGAGMSNRSRIACNSTFKSKRRHAIPAAKPLGKPPRFVVARSANPICRHIWNSICGIAAMLTNRVFVHKSLGTPDYD